MKDVLFQLATGYRVMNPIRGLIPGSPAAGKASAAVTGNDIDRHLDCGNSEWQKKALTYVRERITPDSCYKLKKVVDNEMLNKI